MQKMSDKSLNLAKQASRHIPVMLEKILFYLEPKPGNVFIDATANGGGHLSAIAEKIKPDGKILGIEIDPEIAAELFKNFSEEKSVIIVNQSYANMNAIVKNKNLGPADGIVFDLGMSSLQLEKSGRGFSFLKDEPLDMRFDPKNSTFKASDIINHATQNELERIFKECGQERFAKKIARMAVEMRKHHPILKTAELVECVRRAIPNAARHGKIHFATRIFQALRIAVNNELETVRKGIAEALECLKEGGRIAVISFHSLEDKTVKNAFREGEKTNTLKLLVKKPLQADDSEIAKNPRARSAKLRVAQKIA